MKQILILLISVFYFSQYANSQTNKGESDIIKVRRFSKIELQHDFKQLIKIIDENHPAQYEFISKELYQKFCDNEYSKISDSMSIYSFYTICSSVIGKLGSGHSGVSMYAGFFRDTNIRFFPIKIHWDNKKMYVIQTFGKDKIDCGAEILKINNQSVDIIYKMIYNTISADGLNSSYISGSMNKLFAYSYAMNYGFPKEFRITYKVHGGKKNQEITCLPIKVDEDLKPLSSTVFSCDSLCFKILENPNAAIITIPSFEYRDERTVIFKKFIDESLLEINKKGIKNLIIDLRGNSGGDPFCAAYLLSCFINKPTTFFAGKYITGGINYDSLSYPILPAKNIFKEKPYILIDGLGFSSTGFFCALMKYNKLGVFVGEELGGTYLTTADPSVFTLNNSKLRIRIARAERCVAVEGFPKNRGILPDYEIKPSINDLIENKDRVLEYTIELIKNK